MRSPLQTESLVEWLRKQDAAEIYRYTDESKCLLAQYVRAVGLGHSVGVFCINTWGGSIPLPHGWDAIAAYSPHTFGDALKRAEYLLQVERIRLTSAPQPA